MSTVAGAAVLGACSSGSAQQNSAAPATPLSPAAEAGREVAKDAGCMSCHGGAGEGGVGPGWQGLAGSTRRLGDGSEVVADRAYLVRSITDPGAEKVDGYAVAMPLANLTDEQVDAIVVYIEELS